MKGKLIKRSETDYRLYVNEIPFATTDNSPYKKLSIKNCEAIERGYDLDELVIDEIPDSSSTTLQVQRMRFIHGFQKALEILSDKKFSEQDMYKMFIYGRSIDTAKKHLKELEDKPIDEFFNDFIQSLQQTEWDVEVVMEPEYIRMGGVKGVKGSSTKLSNPAYGCKKTDENGCLILKRI